MLSRAVFSSIKQVQLHKCITGITLQRFIETTATANDYEAVMDIVK